MTIWNNRLNRIIINYDMPKHIETYVHRIRRTVRDRDVCKVTSFFDVKSIEMNLLEFTK